MRAITLPLIDIDLHDTHRLIPSLSDEPVQQGRDDGDNDLLHSRSFDGAFALGLTDSRFPFPANS